MPTIQQLNRQSALLRNVIETAMSPGAGDPSATLALTGNVIAARNRPAGPTTVGGGNIPGVGVGIEPSSIAERFPGFRSQVGQSGQITGRFDTSGVDRRGVSTVSRAGGGTRDESQFVQTSRSDIQPQLEPILSRILESGGTAQARQASQQRQAASAAILASLQQLTPAAAEARAAGAVDAIVRRSLDEALPQLQAAGEGAGASRDALSALQINDIAARTAESAALVIIDAITQFAQAQAQLGSVQDQLTETDPVSRELIQLITGTPTEQRSGSGSLDVLTELGIVGEEELQNILTQVF